MSANNSSYLRFYKAKYAYNMLQMPYFPTPDLSLRDFRTVIFDLLNSADRLELRDLIKKLDVPQYGEIGAAARPVRLYMRSGLTHTMQRTSEGHDVVPMERKLSRISALLTLSKTETEILRFFFVTATGFDTLQAHELESINGPGHYHEFVGSLTGTGPSKAHRALSRLIRRNLLNSSELVPSGAWPPEISPLIFRVLSDDGIPVDQVAQQFYEKDEKEPKPALEESDFEHLRQELRFATAILEDSWRGKKKATNLLLVGPPGVGKSEFARLCVRLAGGESYAVPRADERGDAPTRGERRIQHEFFQRMGPAQRENPVLIVDEADSLLGESALHWLLQLGNDNPSTDDKSWITNVLEQNRLPVIWICNDIDNVSEAVRRRFTYAVEFEQLPQAALRRVWEKHLSGIPKKFRTVTAPIVPELATEDLSPGNIQTCVDTWRRVTGPRHPDIDHLNKIIAQTKHLCHGGESTDRTMLRPPDPKYNPQFLNLQGDLGPNELIEKARKFIESETTGTLTNPSMHSLTLLFSGPPGSGKTTYAQYLSSQVGRPLDVVVCSDILSKFVGSSEKNVRDVFARASKRHAILLLDEFDGIANSRTSAHAGWEITLVNELLHQIENFKGILVACTNLAGALDRAIFRRFLHKIRFESITPENRERVVTEYFGLNQENFPPEAIETLRKLPSLFLSDLRLTSDRLTADCQRNLPSIVRALADEAASRELPTTTSIGFTAS